MMDRQPDHNVASQKLKSLSSRLSLLRGMQTGERADCSDFHRLLFPHPCPLSVKKQFISQFRISLSSPNSRPSQNGFVSAHSSQNLIPVALANYGGACSMADPKAATADPRMNSNSIRTDTLELGSPSMKSGDDQYQSHIRSER